MTVQIQWCGRGMRIGRIVMSLDIARETRISAIASSIGIPAVIGQQDLRAGDLWVGISPSSGWGDLAGDTAWARSCEAEIVEHRLEGATKMMELTIYGPGVSGNGPTLHAHKKGCAHGNLPKYSRCERLDMEAATRADVLELFYGEMARENDDDIASYADQVRFAPCVTIK